MPIYEYRCKKCGFQQEILQKVSDKPLTVCPQCNKKAFDKMVTAAGFQLKGNGWYQTDFKKSPGKPKTEAQSEAKPETKPEAKIDTPKTETKSDSASSAVTAPANPS